MSGEFPLNQWFDTSKSISRDDREMAEAQIALYAIKDGDEPDCKEVRESCAELRAAVKAHNTKMRKAA